MFLFRRVHICHVQTYCSTFSLTWVTLFIFCDSVEQVRVRLSTPLQTNCTASESVVQSPSVATTASSATKEQIKAGEEKKVKEKTEKKGTFHQDRVWLLTVLSGNASIFVMNNGIRKKVQIFESRDEVNTFIRVESWRICECWRHWEGEVSYLTQRDQHK